jgi:hypothetical protein
MTPFLEPISVSLDRIWQVEAAASAAPPPEGAFGRIDEFHGLVSPSHQLKIDHCPDGLRPPHEMS